MSKLILRLDSHMLSDFQRCKALGYLAHVEGWRQDKTSPGMIRGTRWHMLMEFRAEHKQGKISWIEVLTKAGEYLQADGVETSEIGFYISKLSQYHTRWDGDEVNYKFIANEVGFSKVIHETDTVQFIYEGKIDALLEISKNRVVGDHKTQHPGFSGPKYDLFPHSNQFLGYCWASGFRYVMIDYTSWSDPKSKVTDRTFHREFFPIDSALINQWKELTIESFWEILLAVRFNKFPLNRSACDGKYGICQFAKVHEHTSERSQLITLQNNFKREERWEPWNLEKNISSFQNK